jgi:hypothetical protein
MKGLTCNIYRSDFLDPLAVLHDVKRVTLIGEGLPEIFEPDNKAPAVKIGFTEFSGRKHFHAVPIGLEKEWTMSSGSFIWTSDSRFPFDYPVCLHDRVEH